MIGTMIGTISGWTSDASFFNTFPVATLWIAGITVSLSVIYGYYCMKYQYWKMQNVDGPPPVVPFGNSLENFRGQIHEEDMENVAKYGRVFGMYQGTNPALVVTDPDILKDVLVRDFNIFSERFARFFHPIQVQSLIAHNGKRWKDMRSIMTPTFTSGKMKSMHHLITYAVSNMLTYMDNKMVAGSADLNNKELFSDLTMGVIASCAFGTDTNPHQKDARDNIFVRRAKRFFEFNPYMLVLSMSLSESVLRYLKLTPTPPESLNFLIDLGRQILEHRKEMTTDGKKRVDLLQLMIDAERTAEDGSTDRLTDEEIIANIILVLIAGYDTTSTLLSMATYSLALNKLAQDRLRDEIICAVQANGEIKYETIMSLKYMDAVVNETLRLFPPAVRVERTAVQDYVIKKLGIKVGKGDKILVPIYAIHHQAEFYPDPEKFDPDRFMPENKDKLVPYTFLPFVLGPRNCIGARFALLEAKTALAQVLLNYDLSPCPRTTVPLQFNSAILLQAQEVIVRYKKRT